MPPLKYWKIKEYLEDIAVKPESVVRMPTVRELMKQFNVSLATVNRALTVLESDGVIVRRQGAGISAARNTRPVGSASERDEGLEQELVFAYVDYPSERVWSTIHTTDQCAAQRRHKTHHYKIHQDTSTEMLLRCIGNHPRCRGVVLLSGADVMDRERLEALGGLGIPVALLDSPQFYELLPPTLRTFSPDPVDSARKTAALLVQKGHRRIGMVRNEPRSEYTDRHMRALTDAFREAGVPFGPDNSFNATIRSWENSMDAAVAQTRRHLADIRRLGLTAIIYKSCPGALAAIKVLQEEGGFRIPDDIGVTGEGNLPLYDYLTPGLTCVSANYEDMCRAAVDYAVGLSKPAESHVVFPLSVTERNSVRDLRADAPHESDAGGASARKPGAGRGRKEAALPAAGGGRL